jgi:hypothetical protein
MTILNAGSRLSVVAAGFLVAVALSEETAGQSPFTVRVSTLNIEERSNTSDASQVVRITEEASPLFQGARTRQIPIWGVSAVGEPPTSERLPEVRFRHDLWPERF